MTPSEYWESRNREEAQLWLTEMGFVLDRPKRWVKSYALLISVCVGWIFFCCQAVIEVCN